MFADAIYLRGRIGGQVVSGAVVVATGVAMTGERKVLGCAVGDTEDEAFLDRVLPLPALPRAEGGAAGHLGPAPRPQGSHRQGVHRRLLAALPVHFQRRKPAATRTPPRPVGRHRQLVDWYQLVADYDVPELTRFATTIVQWEQQFLNYFDSRDTNAASEGRNLIITQVKRSGFGFRRFDNYRLRALYRCT